VGSDQPVAASPGAAAVQSVTPAVAQVGIAEGHEGTLDDLTGKTGWIQLRRNPST